MVSGRIFDLGLPEDMLDTILARAAGKRFRIPPLVSKHNPVYMLRRNQEICREYTSGVTAEELARKNRISRRRIKSILQENGIIKREEKRATRREQLQEYLGKYNKKTVAAMLGMSRQRLYQIMKEEGL